MRKRILAVLLALCLSLALLPGTALADETTGGAVPSKNAGTNNYPPANWAATVKSYLYENDNGGLTRVEYVNNKVVVEDYSSLFTYISGRTIVPELDRWGGFFAGENYNFLIFGQNNPSEDNAREVIRVVKYDKEWNRLGDAKLPGSNTWKPFEGGSLRCAETNGKLYIRTCHEMYKASDGYHHQASMMLVIDEETMDITDKAVGISESKYAYVSHSFNQFVLIDKEGRLVVADHGDTYPRAIALYRRLKANDSTTIQAFAGAKGNNVTGASFGGLAETVNGYVSAYNYAGTASTSATRRIYLSYTTKNGLQTATPNILTDEGVGGKTPVLASTGLDGGYILWNGTDNSKTLYYAAYSDGGAVGEVQTAEDGVLSDCQPVYYNGQAVWYTTDNDVPVFYTLDEDGLTALRSDRVVCEEHTPDINAGLASANNGRHGYRCTVCQAIVDTVPCTYGEETETKAPTCSEKGERAAICNECGYKKVTLIPTTEHVFGEPVETPPTCTLGGKITVVCTVCGHEEVTEGRPALGGEHEFVRDEEGNQVCQNCGQTLPGGMTQVFDAVQNMPQNEINISADLKDKTDEELESEIKAQIKKYLQDNLADYNENCEIRVEIHRSAAKYSYTVTIIGPDGITLTMEKALNLSAEDETYYISIPRVDNGEIISSTRYAAQGERVTLTAHPVQGYRLDTITVTDTRGRALALRELSGNSYSFAMPDTRVTVNAGFAKTEDDSTPSAPAGDEPFTGLGTPGISGVVQNPAPMPFTDVKAGDWYYDNVDYVWKHYLMSGVSDTEFSPDATTTRAMIWTVLARMNNIRTDVNPGSNWYERGMVWAMEQGVTDGSSPMGDITREQLATMLWRNAGSPSVTADLSRFSDSNTVSNYAKNAVNWAVSNGILNGSDGKLNPQGTATRAQVAAMVMRYGERIGA